MVGREKVDTKKAYQEYKLRIEKRIKSGEDIKVKSYPDWIRTVERTIDGKTVKIQTPGESGETPNEKAVRLGNVRLKKVLSALKGLKTLGTSTQYKFTDAQIKYITGKINDASVDVISSFEGKTTEIVEKIELPK